MDFHLKQWKQEESETDQQSPSSASVSAAKIPKLVFETQQQQHQHTSTLPLFVPEAAAATAASSFSKLTNLSAAFPPDSSTRFPRMGSYFSWAQWQELELQALIYRYMIAGATVPPELLQPIKKSLLHSPYFLHYSHYQPAALLHSGYWGRGAMDPEPGRCRRTDGKKWRCSRDVVAGQKYCERHMHRGRNRSRKPVEIPTPSGPSASQGGGAVPHPTAGVAGGSHFALSGSSPQSIDLFQSYSSEHKAERRGGGGVFGPHNGVDTRSDGHVLRHFFDDWPRSLQDPENSNAANSSTSLSISIPGNSSSDVSLKLSTGAGDEPNNSEQPPMSNWGSGWGPNQVASMGGPLAEALRSSSTATHSSPTSVLHSLPRGSVSETSFVSA